MFFFMLLAYSMVFVLLAAVVCRREWGGCYIWAKIVSSLAFFAVFVISARISGQSAVFFRMLPAFLCCFVGDIFMAVYNRTRRKPYFLLGLVVFLGGHLFFVRWLCGMQTDLRDGYIARICRRGCGVRTLRDGGDAHGQAPAVCAGLYFFCSAFFCEGVASGACEPGASGASGSGGERAVFCVGYFHFVFVFLEKEKHSGAFV